VALDGVRTLLEVGMGVGAETRLLRARWPEMRVVGCDISEAQLGHARRVLAADVATGAVELIRASATAVPLPPATADAGFVCWLLEHVPDPAAVMREVARVVKPGGRVFVTEVYNHSLTVEPTQPALERYWAAVNATQRRAGGHPNIGARLGELAAAAGLEIVSHRFVPVLGDARDPARRQAIMRYFLTLMKSAEPQLRAARAVDERELSAVWAGWEAALAAPDGLFAYTMCKLEARVLA
jgi:SAM-dependent methyltransferase